MHVAWEGGRGGMVSARCLGGRERNVRAHSLASATGAAEWCVRQRGKGGTRGRLIAQADDVARGEAVRGEQRLPVALPAVLGVLLARQRSVAREGDEGAAAQALPALPDREGGENHALLLQLLQREPLEIRLRLPLLWPRIPARQMSLPTRGGLGSRCTRAFDIRNLLARQLVARAMIKRAVSSVRSGTREGASRPNLGLALHLYHQKLLLDELV